MSHQCVNAYILVASVISSLLGGTAVHADNAAVTPSNPTHQEGDTLLCVAFYRTGGSVNLTVSGSGWVSATNLPSIIAINPSGEALRVRFFMNECDSASEANPTVTPSGGAAGATVTAVVVRIRGRSFGANFSIGTHSANGTNTNTIAFTQDSPSIAVGDAILALGYKHNDGGSGSWNTFSGQTAGLTWSQIVADWNSTTGNDQSGAIFGAINDSASAYTAGTGASITGRTLSVGAPSTGVYLKIAAS